jgi:hypothetical protein
MTDHDTKDLVKEAVREFLLALGVNIHTPEAVIELQKDFHHIRNSRLTMGAVRREVGSKVVSVLTGSAVTGMIAAVAFYLTTKGH